MTKLELIIYAAGIAYILVVYGVWAMMKIADRSERREGRK